MRVTTRDGKEYVLEEKLYRQSILFRHLAEETDVFDTGVSILVDADVFAKVVEFMEAHKSDKELPEEYNTFDVMFSDFDRVFMEMDRTLLFKVTSAANYLHVPLLLELCCKFIADRLKEKTTEQIKQYLSIPVDDVQNTNDVKQNYKWI